MSRIIRASDLLPNARYKEMRRDFFRRGIEQTQKRRVALGPHAMLTFQSRDLVLIQVQEMLLAEPGGKAEEELEAYNPLVPDGSSLVFTLMFEIDNPVVRDQTLLKLGRVEKAIELRLSPSLVIAGVPLEERVEVERTSKEGKTSAVHFLRFPLSRAQAESSRGPIAVACTHPYYGHSATLSPETWEEVKRDLD
jgi:hypothetical protein